MDLRHADKTVSPAVAVGIIASVAWIVLVFLYFTFSSERLSTIFDTSILGILTLLSVILPLVLVWTVALTAGTAAKLKKEAKQLRGEMRGVVKNLRETNERLPKEQADIQQQLKLIADMTVQNDKRLKQIANRPVEAAPQIDVVDLNRTVFGDFQSADQDTQITLPLSGPSEAPLPPMPVADLIAALNFPDDVKDKDGFRALRRAMQERKLRTLLESAQKVMSLLTEDGIFMDDLNPDRPVSSAWRKFAEGQRGAEVTSVGGILDKAVLGIARARMKSDPNFRQDVLQFLRQFDQVLLEYEPRLQNHEITDLANTRTARCFMVMARISGAFD